MNKNIIRLARGLTCGVLGATGLRLRAWPEGESSLARSGDSGEASILVNARWPNPTALVCNHRRREQGKDGNGVSWWSDWSDGIDSAPSKSLTDIDKLVRRQQSLAISLPRQLLFGLVVFVPSHHSAQWPPKKLRGLLDLEFAWFTTQEPLI